MASAPFRFFLDPGPKKFHCPGCGQKRLVRYLDGNTNEYLPHHYGRCDRQDRCGYHLNPYQDGYAQAHNPKTSFTQNRSYASTHQHKTTSEYKHKNTLTQNLKTSPPPEPEIPFSVLNALQNPKGNGFAHYLCQKAPFPFPPTVVREVFRLYRIGTIPRGPFQGATAFPFIDDQDILRAVQVKQFDEGNHTTRTTFLHSLLAQGYRQNHQALPEWLRRYQQTEKKICCLFGAHLLAQYPERAVGLVEAPKTALYATLYFGHPSQNPQAPIWLAAYSLSSLGRQKCMALQGRNVRLFPDLSENGHAYRLWQEKAEALEEQIPFAHFEVSDYLEQKATPAQREAGHDLADFLIALDWRPFQHPQQPAQASAQHHPTLEQLKRKNPHLAALCQRLDLQAR